jgi:hypothetical protein
MAYSKSPQIEAELADRIRQDQGLARGPCAVKLARAADREGQRYDLRALRGHGEKPQSWWAS